MLFGFEITMPFVAGVCLVILSIFIYGAKPEQITGWMASVKRALGLGGGGADYALVAQMEPIDGSQQQPIEAVGDGRADEEAMAPPPPMAQSAAAKKQAR
jgi:hypothetical protein